MKLITEKYIGSMTGKTEEEQIQMLETFREKDRGNKIKISIQPELVNKELLKTFKAYGVTTIELEVQSANSYILKRCGYTYNIEDIKKASRMIKWKRIQIIIFSMYRVAR